MLRKLKSFSTRLSLYIVSVVGILFLASFAFYYHAASHAIKNEAFQKAKGQLSLVTKNIDAILEGVELNTANTANFIGQSLDDPSQFERILRNMICSNPSIYGASIAMEPDFYKSYGRYYMKYGYRNNTRRDSSEIKFDMLGSNAYDYHIMNWYQIPKLLAKDYWSEPYYDEGGGNTLMTTFTRLLRDSTGKMVGVLTADVSLELLSDMVLASKPYPDSYAFMLSRNAYYLVHPNKSLILNQTIFTETDALGDTSITNLGYDMIHQHDGFRTFDNRGVESVAFYEPIRRIGWSVGMVLTKNSVLAEFDRMSSTVLIIALCGLLLIFVFSVIVIRGSLHPLKIFSHSASIVAKGNFDSPIPEIKSRDEMYELRQSFINMQHSLKEYISELKSTTAIKQRIESELSIANKIQMGMLPKVFPPFPNHESIDLYAKVTPAKEVGGDLYDFFIRDDKLFFTVGDASGKGIPASLLMAVTISLFRFVASHKNSPEKILEDLNNAVAESNETNMFITLFVGILDLTSGELKYSNAGHNPPVMLSSDKNVQFIETEPNLALGVFPKVNFKCQTTTMHVGDSLFLYSDGLTEAENSDKQLYSESRLIDALKSLIPGTPREAVAQIENSVHEYVQDNEQSDDLTMMMITLKNGTPMTKELILQNDISEISKLAQFVEEVGEELSLEPSLVMNLNLALEEAISNIILYAYPEKLGEKIWVHVVKVDGVLTFTLSDTGIEFDPTKLPDADITLSAEERGIGGLGIYLIRKIMDDVKYERIDGQNILTIKKEL